MPRAGMLDAVKVMPTGPGGPVIRVEEIDTPNRLASGEVLLRPYTIPTGPTVYDRMPLEREWDPNTQQFVTGRINIHGGKDGWIFSALGSEREGLYASTAKLFLQAFLKVDKTKRVWLSPRLNTTDPYYRKGGHHVPWVDASCVATAIKEGAALGLKFVVPSRFATQELLKLQKNPDSSKWRPNIIDELELDFKRDDGCHIEKPRGDMTLEYAANVLEFESLDKAISASPANLYNHYIGALKSVRGLSAHDAYHRILMHRFLRGKTLVPSTRDKDMSRKFERSACLLQAHRLFIFNRLGCPVAINRSTVNHYGLQFNAIKKRSATSPYGKLPEWTEWLFEFVLRVDKNLCLQNSLVRSMNAAQAAMILKDPRAREAFIAHARNEDSGVGDPYLAGLLAGHFEIV